MTFINSEVKNDEMKDDELIKTQQGPRAHNLMKE